jgi:farnesyl-diphosphate farnesyltransferase
VPLDRRLEALRELTDRIVQGNPAPLPLPELESRQSSPGERVLLARIDDFLALLRSLPPEDLERVQRVLATITSGQELDLLRFDQATELRIKSLETAEELDDYTFRVAGCVGEFWTRMCVAHLRPAPAVPLEEMVFRGVRFGKGLQLVNILRDLPKDLRQGRCYLPEPEIAAAGLSSADLLMSQNEARLRPVYNRWLQIAEDHLRAGWGYVLDLPRSWVRVRLACAWPILIGVATLDKLKRENVLDAARRIKVSRPEVKRMMRSSVLALPFRSRWAALPRRWNPKF